jgi:regulator of sigma E protease
MLQTILAFIIVFGIIVIVHEFGHFYFAKKAGVLVREFSIGMGPKLFQTHRNETSYTIRVLPLGGYVMMAGFEEEEDIRLGMPALLHLDEKDQVTEIDLSDENMRTTGVPVEVLEYDFEDKLFIKGSVGGDLENTVTYSVKENAIVVQEDGTKLQIAPANRRFQNASLKDRILTNFGGPLNNFLLAIIAFIALGFLQGGVASNEPLIGEVQEDSPAIETQMETGDRVLSIDGEDISSWNEMLMTVQAHPNEPLEFEIQKENQDIIIETITPRAVEATNGTEIGQIGVQVLMKDSFLDKLTFGFTETWFYIKNIFTSILLLVTGQISTDNLGGPVAIYQMTSEVTQTAGWLGIVNFIGFLSVNLGLMNLFPIPALDGGKLLLNFIEGVRGKPISEETETMLTLISVVLLLLLMVFVTWNDIQRFFFN